MHQKPYYVNIKKLSFDNNIKHRKGKKSILSGRFGDSMGEQEIGAVYRRLRDNPGE